MDDLISRRQAIDALSQYPFEKVVNCISIIEDLPSAQTYTEEQIQKMQDLEQAQLEEAYRLGQSEQRWIPCNERLPENGKQVLVYARSVHYALAKYDEMREADGTYKKQWVTFDAWKPFYTIKEVIAWMPLPEPYREDGE